MKIIDIKAREIIASRGNPTVEVDLFFGTKVGQFARAMSPSGASRGEREACELRDGNSKRFLGKGVLKAVSNVNNIIKPAILGVEISNQQEFDSILLKLDGTHDKSKLGGNATIAASMAFMKAEAALAGKPLFSYINRSANILPTPMINILNGGAHADNGLEIQEFMVVPVSAASMSDAIRMGSEIASSLKSILVKKGLSTGVGDEGGFAPKLRSNVEAIETVLLAIDAAGYAPGKDVMLALDVAASEFYKDGRYHIESQTLSSEGMVTWFSELVSQFPICSIEDGLAQNDYDGWIYLTERLAHKTQLVGDDIFVTNSRILSDCIDKKIANAILIKPNQVGTITETLNAVSMAMKHGYKCIMSHRSGETEDTTISHLAVGYGCSQIKTGAICRSDRTAKYNELIRIEESLKESLQYDARMLQNKASV
jgi:enolase